MPRIRLQPYQKKPTPIEVDKDGRGVYKTYDDYLNAHDEWIEAEIRRSIDENMYDDTGLSIQVDMAGQPVNPDPRHPTPDKILGDGMRSAGIEVTGSGGSADKGTYRVFLMIGHRPRVLGNQEPVKYKISRWIESLGQQ
jgi:hypothetical protein